MLRGREAEMFEPTCHIFDRVGRTGERVLPIVLLAGEAARRETPIFHRRNGQRN